MIKQIIIIFTLLANIVFAQWSTDTLESLKVYGSGIRVEACADGDGGVYVVWLSYNYDDSRVYLQHLDKYGNLKWNSPLEIGFVTTFQFAKAYVVSDNSGGVYVAYDQLTAIDTIDTYVVYEGKSYIQRVSSDGKLLWGEGGIRVSLDSTEQREVKLVGDGEGNAIVGWIDLIDGSYDYENIFYVQKISRSGKRLWSDSGMVVDTLKYGSEYQITSDMHGGVIAAYPYGYESKDYIFIISNPIAKHIEKMGNVLWADTLSFSRDLLFDGLRSDEHGNSVVFVEVVYPSESGERAIRINYDGEYDWGESGIAFPYDEQYFPEDLLTFDSNNETTFIWRDQVDSVDVQSLQKITVDGNKKWVEDKILNDNYVDYHIYSMLKSNDNSYVLLKRLIGDPSKFYAEKLDSNGNYEWKDVILTEYGGEEVEIVSDGNGGMIVVWSRFLYGIFAQQISRDGNLGEVIVSIDDEQVENIPTEVTLEQNYPNPFNPSTTIRYSLSQSGFVNLHVYNILGQEVAKLVNEEQNFGNYEVQFEATNLPSGVYFCKLNAVSLGTKGRMYEKSVKMLLLK